MRKIRYHDEARLELIHEVGYYSAINRQLGERFDQAIQAAVARAAEHPNHGAPFHGGTRRVLAKTFPFSIVYESRDDEIIVLAIAPFSRNPSYWRERKIDE